MNNQLLGKEFAPRINFPAVDDPFLGLLRSVVF